MLEQCLLWPAAANTIHPITSTGVCVRSILLTFSRAALHSLGGCCHMPLFLIGSRWWRFGRTLLNSEDREVTFFRILLQAVAVCHLKRHCVSKSWLGSTIAHNLLRSSGKSVGLLPTIHDGRRSGWSTAP